MTRIRRATSTPAPTSGGSGRAPSARPRPTSWTSSSSTSSCTPGAGSRRRTRTDEGNRAGPTRGLRRRRWTNAPRPEVRHPLHADPGRARSRSGTASTRRSQCTGFGADRPGQQAYHRAMKAAGGFAVVHTEWARSTPRPTSGRRSRASCGTTRTPATSSSWSRRSTSRVRWPGCSWASTGAAPTTSTRASARAAWSRCPVRHLRLPLLLHDVEARDPRAPAASTSSGRAAGEAGRLRRHPAYARARAPVTQQFLMPRYNHRTDEYGGNDRRTGRVPVRGRRAGP